MYTVAVEKSTEVYSVAVEASTVLYTVAAEASTEVYTVAVEASTVVYSVAAEASAPTDDTSSGGAGVAGHYRSRTLWSSARTVHYTALLH